MVFHGHFGGVFHLFGRAADNFGVCARRHGTRYADFALAADVRAGNRRVGFIQNTDGTGSQQEIFDTRLVGVRIKFAEIVQDGRNNACRAVGRCGYNAAAGGVFFIDRHSVHHRPKLGIDDFALAQDFEFGRQLRRAAADVQAARQLPFRTQAALDAVFHHIGHSSHTAAHFRLIATCQRCFIGQHDFGNIQLVQTALCQQLVTVFVRIWHVRIFLRFLCKPFVCYDKTAANRIIDLFFQLQAV